MSYVKLHRTIVGHWVWQNAEYYRLWSLILMEANWKDSKALMGGDFVTIKRGDVLTSLKRLSELSGSSIQTVRTFLEYAERDGMIAKQATRFATHLTVCNYETYQEVQHGLQHASNTPATQQQHASNNIIEVLEGKNTHTHPAREAVPMVRPEPPTYEQAVTHAQTVGIPTATVVEWFNVRDRDEWTITTTEGKPKPIRKWQADLQQWHVRNQSQPKHHAPHRPTQPAHGERVGFDPEQAVERRTELQRALDRAFEGVDDTARHAAQRPALIATEARTHGPDRNGTTPPELHGRPGS